MVGTEDECEEYVATITVLGRDQKDFASMSSHPRPLDEQAWGNMGLTMSKKDFSKIAIPTTRTMPVIYDSMNIVHCSLNNFFVHCSLNNFFDMKVTICKL